MNTFELIEKAARLRSTGMKWEFIQSLPEIQGYDIKTRVLNIYPELETITKHSTKLLLKKQKRQQRKRLCK